MRYAILSDIHANVEALDRVLDDVARQRVDHVIALGDTLGYGPEPAKALERIRACASCVLMGNHDAAVLGKTGLDDFNDLAREAVLRQREELSHGELRYLKKRALTVAFDEATCAHGDIVDPKAFRYIDSEEAARENFACLKTPLLFVGHTHVPNVYLTGASGAVYALKPEDFVLEEGKRYIVNVGSVGYPREADGVCLSSYVIYDTQERSVRFRFLPFDVGSLLPRRARKRPGVLPSLMLVAGLALVALLALVSFKPSRSLSADGATPPLQEETVLLHGHERSLRANLTLAPKSPEAQLTIAFFDGQGRPVAPAETFRVKQKSRREFEIPRAALKAVCAVRAASTNGTPVVKSFAPTAE